MRMIYHLLINIFCIAGIGCQSDNTNHTQNKDSLVYEKKSFNDIAQTSEDFTNFLKNFNNTFNVEKIFDLPEVPWSRRFLEYKIESNYMESFVWKCLHKYTNPMDSLLADFLNKNDTETFLGYYLAKLNHPNEKQVAVLLIDLVQQKNNHSNEVILLTYFLKETGEPLGYDIVAGAKESGESIVHGRLNMVNEKLCIEKFFLSQKLYAQKYLVNLGSPIRKEIFNKPTMDLSDKPKIIDSISYKTHCDKITLTCVDFPYEVFVFGGRTILENADETFLSKDQKAKLVIHRNIQMKLEGEDALKKWYRNTQKYLIESDSKISYQFLGKDFFIFSGTDKEGLIFYQKNLLMNSSHFEFSLHYPAHQKIIYDKIAKQIHYSFQSLKGN